MDDRRRDGGTNSTLRTKEQGTHLTLNEHLKTHQELKTDTDSSHIYNLNDQSVPKQLNYTDYVNRK